MMQRRRRGSGLVEFAFGFSALTLLFVGLADVSLSMIVYHQLSAAVSNGARYASAAEFDEPAHRFAGRTRKMVACGNPEGEPCRETAPGLRPEQVKVSWTRDPAGKPETITVAIEGYRMPGLFSRRLLNGAPSATVRFAGSWRPGGAAALRRPSR